jgi:hypothetical protein
MTPTDLETLRAAVGPMSGTISIGNVSVSKEALTALLAEYERMREWITEKAWHSIGCNRDKKYYYRSGKRVPHDGSCDCGFDALRATLSEGERG